MGYQLNFNYIWKHFDRLLNGLILSLELAVISILIGMLIGLLLALVYTDRGRFARYMVAAYVEFIRNVPLLLLFAVRLPTMFRIVLPSLSNTFISLFKDTSIASVIAVPELTYGAQWINFNTFRIIEVNTIVLPMYLFTGWAILIALQQLEKKFTIRR